ncbi:MAG: hypothetical protein FJ265_11205 [Planctomycetes bacterium]|nr:hypothetical protein [Planctomycetota bacterium]
MTEELLAPCPAGLGLVRQIGSHPAAASAARCHSGTGAGIHGLLAVLALSLPAPAQEPTFELALASGEVLVATSIEGDPARGLDVESAQGRRRLQPGELLALQGAPALLVELPSAWLAGGDVVRGALAGGDAAGEHLELLSPCLGRVALATDRLQALVGPGAEAAAALPLPPGVGEAIVQRAAFGYDLLAGAVHQFGERGVSFQPDGDGGPRWFRLQDLVGLRIADPAPRAAPAGAFLRTRTGDHLGVRVRAFTKSGLLAELESGAPLDVRRADVASLVFASVGTFLSDLEPAEVAESGFDGDAVLPWRRDLNVLGAPLVAAGRTCGKGLGVHSRSRLAFVVPAGVRHFWTRVAIDDSAAGLPLRAHADARVYVNDARRFEAQGLLAGRPVRDSGLLPVAPGDRVVLEVDFGEGRDLGDRVDWLLPVFLPAKGNG